MSALADKVIEYCRDLALLTEEPGRITRTFLSPPMHDVHRMLGAWMLQLGMDVSVDAAGNLRGVRAGTTERRFVIGSHLDTVPNAGAFDGILGVVLGVALIEALGDAPLEPAIEVIGFSEEEGVRFGIPFIGSRAVAGTLDESVLTPGVLDAICAFGLDPSNLAAARLSSDAFACLEFHIEQGPVLESLGLPLGIVDAIAGQSRLAIEFRGKAGHAGTTPMALRKDALAATSEWICEVEKTAADEPGLVATAGSIVVEPNASNVIPELARVSLDVRHATDAARHAAVAKLLDAAARIAARRGIAMAQAQHLDQPAVVMDCGLRARLAAAVREAGYPVQHLTSGAGHDAMIVARVLPAAMLFLRSPGGISHHPDESVLPEDVDAALEAGRRFIHAL
ncbi:MAG TPA: allantoate amidohydrolase [Bryobacteraceae bacterium]|jgi:allantoate deiminase|nr:allantoate amidohydrolase [Bryobacteraceae bacterium]